MKRNDTHISETVYATVCFAISVLFVFYKYVLEVSPSIMVGRLMEEFRTDGFVIGHIAAAYYYAYTVMQIPGGLLVDAFGSRRIAALGILLCAIGSLLFGMGDKVATLAFARFITGIGATFAILNTFKVIADRFSESRFALFAGLTMTLGTLGAVFGQAPLSRLIRAVGWRHSFKITALFGILLAGLFFIVIRDLPSLSRSGLRHHTGFLKTSLMHILRRKETWILSLYSGLAFAPVASFAGLWGVTFIERKYGFTKSKSAFLASLVFVGFAIGAPLLGYYSSRIGKRKPVMVWGTTIALITLTLSIYLPPASFSSYGALQYGALQLLFGISVSAFLLSFSVIHEINIPLMTATAVAVMNTSNALFNSLTDPLVGWLLDLGGTARTTTSVLSFSLSDYHFAFALFPLYMVGCLVLLVFTEETYCRQKHLPDADG
ncbi:MAG: MFS transporter [Simkaniaceae bacterium]|nr:MFS transporter [Simkaniaceae bacterium]